jgi:hypothetical protein
MTSLRQIESNRRNAQKSTGPKTETGKQRASRNAVRHGLSAETVVKLVEDPDDYQAFELAITTDYDAETAVERELVLRLASLLWRLRRATSIETGLLQIRDEMLTSRAEMEAPRSAGNFPVVRVVQPGQAAAPLLRRDASSEVGCCEMASCLRENDGLDIVHRFLRLADVDKGAFDRLGRYETALWRQVRQTIFTLEDLRWRASTRSWRRQKSWHRTIGDE